jgi:hypothetical protein
MTLGAEPGAERIKASIGGHKAGDEEDRAPVVRDAKRSVNYGIATET